MRKAKNPDHLLLAIGILICVQSIFEIGLQIEVKNILF